MNSQKTEAIYFFSAKGRWGALSNFAATSIPIVYEGRGCPTAEHAYQMAKFCYRRDVPDYAEYMDEIAKCKTAYEAYRMGRQKSFGKFLSDRVRETIDHAKNLGIVVDPNWRNRRVRMMEEILWIKFRTCVNSRSILLRTGKRRLVEKSPTDSFWGVGEKMNGENRLGKLLEKIRTTLQAEDPASHKRMRTLDAWVVAKRPKETSEVP